MADSIVKAELEVDGLPDAPEGGVWSWSRANDNWTQLTLIIGDTRWSEYVSDSNDSSFCAVAQSLIRKYKETRRLELLAYGAVELVPAPIEVKDTKHDKV